MSKPYVKFKPKIVYVMGRGKELGGYYYQLNDIYPRIGPFPSKREAGVAVSQHIHDMVSRAGGGTTPEKVDNWIM